MRLNDAHIENMLDAAGNELTLVRKFGEVVKHAELVADVYMNDHKVFTAPVCVTENTGYLMASIDGRFALDPAVTLERVLVRVRHIGRDEVLFSSNTVGVNQPIDAYDYDADIYFRLMNVWEGNTTRTRAPETKFRCLYKNTFGTINLDEQPSAYDDVEPDTSSDGSSEGGSESGSQGGSEGGEGSQSGSDSGSGNTEDPGNNTGDNSGTGNDSSDVTSGTLSVQVTGSTDLVAQPLWLDDETFSPGFELQVTQNVSHTLMIPLVHGAAEISIEDVDGFSLDSDIQYVDPLPDNQQRPDVVKNALVQFTMGVDYVLLNVNAWIAVMP